MAVRYLIDTAWVIAHLRQIECVVNRLKELRPQGLPISIISLAELSEGVPDSRPPAQRRQALEAFREAVSVLGIAEEICEWLGRERGRLRPQGALIGDVDLLIAATGRHYGLTVLTDHRRHGARVEGLKPESV
jgi:tRNA(fMet)-specific endonuclease VapC